MQPLTERNSSQNKWLIILAFAALYIIWGSTYTAILFAIEHIPPLIMAGTRFAIAGLILFVYFRVKGQPTPPPKSLAKISFGGILMLFVGTGAVAWVEQYISSGLAAIIVASTPLWFVILDKRQWKYNFSNKWILIGLVVGFIGVLTLFSDKKTIDFGDRMQIISFFLLIVGTISWAAGSLYSKYQKVEATTGMKAAIQMLSAGICAIIVGLLMGEGKDLVWSEINSSSLFGLAYLIVFGSLVGFMAYVWLLSVRPASLVGTYAYVNPVVAMFLGWWMADEIISHQQIIALGIILAGVILVTLSNTKKE
jgi:drug/metabolite transporter (DMT)-like permease